MIPALTGFVAGVLHVVSGPDHLAAVAPLAAGRGQRAWVTGVRWGLGHASGVLLMGAGLLLLRGVLPMDLVSSWAERLVGVVLIGLGIWALRRALDKHVHTHEHTHGTERHMHIHVHGPGQAHATIQSHAHTHAPFAIGALHGVAGSSHLMGILPALAFPSTLQAISYLGSYCLGTMVAMASFATAVGLLARGCALTGLNAYRFLMVGCSAAAFAVGTYWLVA